MQTQEVAHCITSATKIAFDDAKPKKCNSAPFLTHRVVRAHHLHMDSRELRAAAHLPLHSSQVRPVVDECVDDLDVPGSRSGQGQVESLQALFIVHSGLHTHHVSHVRDGILLRPVTMMTGARCPACPGMFCFKLGSMLELTS